VRGRLVTNTGPLIALAGIDRLDILRILFTSVHVPQAVHDEMVQGGETRAGLDSYRQADWIVVEPAVPLDPLLSNVLDEGEAAVIILARSLGADTVLIDERKARKVARDIYGLRVMGSARLLVEAKRHGVLDNVAAALQAMRDQGYWIHDSIVQYALREAGEIDDLSDQ
jgi:predicted nucleic acid-binding protein